MKTRKRFNISLALLVTLIILPTSSLFAQQRHGQGPPPIPNESQINKMVTDLSTKLSLNDDQKTEILSLYINHFDKVKSLMNSEKRPSRETMENLKTEFKDDVKSTLKDDQKEKYDEFIKNNMPQKGRGRQKKQNKK